METEKQIMMPRSIGRPLQPMSFRGQIRAMLTGESRTFEFGTRAKARAAASNARSVAAEFGFRVSVCIDNDTKILTVTKTAL